jgi:hypothetical protein
MKKIILIVLFALSFIGCTREVVKVHEIKNNRHWKVGRFVDDFGEKTGEVYHYQDTKGTFSNSVYTSQRLHVSVLLNKNNYMKINLHEYSWSNAAVTFTEANEFNREMTSKRMVKVKYEDGTIENYSIEPGEWFNGHWLLKRFGQHEEAKFYIVGDYGATYKFTIDVSDIKTTVYTEEY